MGKPSHVTIRGEITKLNIGSRPASRKNSTMAQAAKLRVLRTMQAAR
jgi:phosphoenolpyruvate carboxylase